MHRMPQFAFHPLFDVLLFVAYLCYFNEGCEVVASSLLHKTVRVSLYVYFDLLLICVADASPHFLVTYCGCRVTIVIIFSEKRMSLTELIYLWFMISDVTTDTWLIY